MAKIQAIKKLVVEDFPEENRVLVEKLAGILNPFLDQVNTALSQKLTYADNLKSKVYSFQLAAGVSTIVLAWDFNEKPTAVYIGNLTRANGTAPSSAAFSLSTYQSDKKLNITFIGLDSATAYSATVIAQI